MESGVRKHEHDMQRLNLSSAPKCALELMERFKCERSMIFIVIHFLNDNFYLNDKKF